MRTIRDAVRFRVGYTDTRGVSVLCHCEEYYDVAIADTTQRLRYKASTGLAVIRLMLKKKRICNVGKFLNTGDCHVVELLAMTIIYEARSAPNNG